MLICLHDHGEVLALLEVRDGAESKVRYEMCSNSEFLMIDRKRGESLEKVRERIGGTGGKQSAWESEQLWDDEAMGKQERQNGGYIVGYSNPMGNPAVGNFTSVFSKGAP